MAPKRGGSAVPTAKLAKRSKRAQQAAELEVVVTDVPSSSVSPFSSTAASETTQHAAGDTTPEVADVMQRLFDAELPPVGTELPLSPITDAELSAMASNNVWPCPPDSWSEPPAAQDFPTSSPPDTVRPDAASSTPAEAASRLSPPAEAAKVEAGADLLVCQPCAAEVAPSPRVLDQNAMSMVGSLRSELSVQRPKCVKCDRECDPLRSYLKSKTCNAHAMRWICGDCNRVTSCLSRNLQWPPAGFQQLSADKQVSFFEKACDQAKDGRLSYQRLKGLVVNTLVESEMEVMKATSSGTFKPLSYYATEGATEAMLKNIEEQADSELHPVLGITYKVDFKSVERASILTRVQETLTKSERVVHKTSPSGKGGEPNVLDEMAEDPVQPVAEEPKPLPPTEAESKRQAKEQEKERSRAEKKQEMEQKKLEKKAEADRQRHNLKMLSLASKATLLLEPLKLEQDKLLSKPDLILDRMIKSVLDDLVASRAAIADMVAAASNVTKLSVKASKKREWLPTLAFDMEQLRQTNKDGKDVAQKFTSIEKVLGGASQAA